MLLNEGYLVGNSKPRRDRRGVRSEHFDARLGLASRHLRNNGFAENGSYILIWQRGCGSFEKEFPMLDLQLDCVLEIALEP